MNHFLHKLLISPLILLLSLLLVSCDPAMIVSIENQTDAPATISLTFNQQDRNYQWDDSDTTTHFVIQLDTADQSVKDYYFGLGHWKVPGALDSLAASISKIEIQGPGANATYTGFPQIKDFFESRISKKYKGQIKIVLK
jgi:hypothetical protein